ncbi:hypothetical protein SESBI_09517 [Sesbania bispinosa]|nr:hypothetical protein SESBI_09517 [Sesbania bispinosa]
MTGVDVKTPEKVPELVEDFEKNRAELFCLQWRWKWRRKNCLRQVEGSPEQGDLGGGGGDNSRSPERRKSAGEDKKVADCWQSVAVRFSGQDEGGAANTVLLLDRAKNHWRQSAGKEPDVAGKNGCRRNSSVVGEIPVTILGFLGL